jgi:hypothetical protein
MKSPPRSRGDAYRWRKVTDVGREYALFELMCGETVLLDLGFSDDGRLEISFDTNICGKTVRWDEFADLLKEGETLAMRDR